MGDKEREYFWKEIENPKINDKDERL